MTFLCSNLVLLPVVFSNSAK